MASQNVHRHRSRNQRVIGSIRQGGVSLIELMIGITVGLIILAGVVTVVAKTTFSGLENVRAVQLNQQIRGTMDLIRRDLQRAGYVEAWTPGSATVTTSTLDMDAINTFGTVTLTGTCTTTGGVTTCTCILYSYDRNADGVKGDSGAGFELYGFRLNNGAIETRRSGTTHNCTSGQWWDLTDASVNVTALGFEHDLLDSTTYYINGTGNGSTACPSGEVCLDRRKINISVTAELSSDSAVKVQISNEVKIKNDHYYTAS